MAARSRRRPAGCLVIAVPPPEDAALGPAALEGWIARAPAEAVGAEASPART